MDLCFQGQQLLAKEKAGGQESPGLEAAIAKQLLSAGHLSPPWPQRTVFGGIFVEKQVNPPGLISNPLLGHSKPVLAPRPSLPSHIPSHTCT